MRIAPTITIWIGLLALAGGCERLGPTGGLDPMAGSLWALEAIDDAALPTAAGPVLAGVVVADTLAFGVEDARWAPRPLARSDRLLRIDGQLLTEAWFYTYDEGPAGQFAIRALCADGDLASCVDGSAVAVADGHNLRIEFAHDELFGTLHYHRVR